jgi:ligand-binding SRPBCC domain-containing protein
MTTLRHEVHANCGPERVWALLADLEAVERYNPGVRAARIEGSTRTGVGAKRVCDLHPNGRVVERVTVWEEQRALGLEVVESPFPIHFMRWVTKIDPRGDGTVITQDLEYQVKLGPLGWVLDRLVMKRKLRATLDSVFAGLVEHAEGRR